MKLNSLGYSLASASLSIDKSPLGQPEARPGCGSPISAYCRAAVWTFSTKQSEARVVCLLAFELTAPVSSSQEHFCGHFCEADPSVRWNSVLYGARSQDMEGRTRAHQTVTETDKGARAPRPGSADIQLLFFSWLCWVCFAAQAFSGRGEPGLLCSCGAPASPCGVLLFQSMRSRAQTQELGCPGFVTPWHGESSWIKHVSPALASGFLTTGPPGKPPGGSLKKDSRGGIFSEILRSVPWLTWRMLDWVTIPS